jgi:hypothetical protein
MGTLTSNLILNSSYSHAEKRAEEFSDTSKLKGDEKE